MHRVRRRGGGAGRFLAACALWVASTGAPAADAPRLLSPADGPITEVLLAAPDAGAVHVQALAAVARVLGGAVRYRVVAPAPAFAPVGDALRAAGAQTVLHVPAPGPITPWVRDALFVLRMPTGLAWAPSGALRRAGDGAVAARAVHADPTITSHPSVPLEGGNVVAHGARVFVGGRAGRLAGARRALPGMDWHAVTSAGVRADGPWAGRGQALYHLDLYLAAAGSADAPVLLVGAVPPPAAAPGARLPGENTLRAALDATAAQLELAGFAVRRVPVARVRDPDDGAPLLISYTNVLLDTRAGTPVVYLPRYGAVLAGLEALDGMAAAVYHDLGYAVVWYEGPLRALARAGGGLRCLVLETARGE